METETFTHFLCLCPFHGNTDTPALAVDKTLGMWICFNPSCDLNGDLRELLTRTTDMNIFQALRFIIENRNAQAKPVIDRLNEALTKESMPEFPQSVLDRAKIDFPGSIAQEYMRSRGFDDDTLDYFDVGYSKAKGMVIVPMHDYHGNPIGLIGRTPSHENKVFKNSTGLPKARTAWNIHRAKREGGTVIVCEASYDAMRIHQAGFPNVIALLGGSVTANHLDQINKNFDTVYIMSDFDKKQYRPNCRQCGRNVRCEGHRPGRELGRSISRGLPHRKIMWGAYDNTCVFPHDAKDASDMTDDEIRQCMKNAVSNLEYTQWDIENRVAATA